MYVYIHTQPQPPSPSTQTPPKHSKICGSQRRTEVNIGERERYTKVPESNLGKKEQALDRTIHTYNRTNTHTPRPHYFCRYATNLPLILFLSFISISLFTLANNASKQRHLKHIRKNGIEMMHNIVDVNVNVKHR
jgi:hypothetical protein